MSFSLTEPAAVAADGSLPGTAVADPQAPATPAAHPEHLFIRRPSLSTGVGAVRAAFEYADSNGDFVAEASRRPGRGEEAVRADLAAVVARFHQEGTAQEYTRLSAALAATRKRIAGYDEQARAAQTAAEEATRSGADPSKPFQKARKAREDAEEARFQEVQLQAATAGQRDELLRKLRDRLHAAALQAEAEAARQCEAVQGEIVLALRPLLLRYHAAWLVCGQDVASLVKQFTRLSE